MSVLSAGFGAVRRTIRAAASLAVVVAAVLLVGCGTEEEKPNAIANVNGVVLADLTRDDFAAELEDGCLTAGCHQQLSQRRWVHGPVAVQACTVCHEPSLESDDEHGFGVAVAERDLCLRCHQVDTADEYVHEPYGSANCTGCHDPHGGERKDFLRTERVDQLCLTCHPAVDVAVPHLPRENGDCLSCHEPHSSRHKHLLLRRENELCGACHREFRGFLAENIRDEGLVGGVHPALLTEGCLGCHQAHGSQMHAMLRAELGATCRRCHSDLDDGIESAEVVHEAFVRDESCVKCHTPHASPYDGLLVDSPEKVCFQCHAEEIETRSGRTIPNIEQKIADGAFVHFPVAEGECTVCHIAHFSSQRSLLRLEYPDRIYRAFTGGSYELCFQCHDRQLIAESGSRVTGFRDGERNLHFLHVNREKGRACDICHDPHAGDGYRLIRESFPFGPEGWLLPLGFEQTDTGGSCASACHERESYSR